MNSDRTKKYIDFAAGIIVFGAFAVCMLAVVLAGAGITGRISSRDSASADMRICAGYITTRVQSAENKNGIYVSPSDEAEGGILCIPETVDGTEYVTCVYCYDGSVRELFAPADYAPVLAAGSVLTNARSVKFDINGNLLTAEIDLGNGNTGRSVICLSAGEGGANG